MTERTVKVSLILAAQGYMAGMDEAAKKTRETGAAAEKLAQQRQAFDTLGRAALGMGAAIGVGAGIAIAKFADFDQQMSYVQAATHETAASMDLLRDAALEAGARTVYSATEAAAAIEELAKAGVSTKDILAGGLDAALDLAAAGGLGVAEAAGIAATALKTFNLRGEDMSHVADLLAAGAGKAMGDVSQLAQALAQGGQVAKQTGLSIEETTAGLSAFAAQGLLGSDAGTSFKSMLQRLTPQSAEAQRMMDELGISAYDATGNFIGLTEFAGNLQAALRDLTPEQRNAAMATIFGSDAVRAASVLYSEGADGIQEWIDAVNDQGYAAETAAMRLDNLAGDVEALGGAFDTALITSGSGANDMLRMLVQGATAAVDVFNGLPASVQGTITVVGIAAAGIALVGGAALIAVPKVAEFRIALQTLGITGDTTRAGLGRFVRFLGGPWGIAMLAAGAAMATFTKIVEDGVPSQAEITNAMKTSESAAGGLKAAFERGSLESTFMGDYAAELKDLPGLLDHAIEAQDNWGVALSTTIGQRGAYDSLKRYGQSLAELASTDLPAATSAFRELVQSYDLTDKQAVRLLEEMGPYRDALLEQADAQGISKDSAEFLQLAMGKLPGQFEATRDAAQEAEQALTDTAQALEDVGSAAMALGDSHDRALSAINALADAAEAEAVTLDGTNDASIRFRDSLRDVEKAHRDSAQAILDNGGTLQDAQSEWAAGRQAIVDMLTTMGLAPEEAAAWADANLGAAGEVTAALEGVKSAVDNIPESKAITITADTTGAQNDIDRLIVNNNDKRIVITADVDYQSPGGITVTPNEAGGFYAYAAGGIANHIPSGIYKGGSEIHKFAEKSLPWETYISPALGARDRNLAIWEETGTRLGAWERAPESTGLQALADRLMNGQDRPINIDVHSQPGMNETQLARKTAKAINDALR